MAVMKRAGIKVANSPAEIGSTMLKAVQEINKKKSKNQDGKSLKKMKKDLKLSGKKSKGSKKKKSKKK